MKSLIRASLVLLFGGLVLGVIGVPMAAWTGMPVVDDPLVRMPGTQPNQVTLEAPNRCLNCHDGYDPVNEIGSNWKGSMMAQASRDFVFWACMTVSAQDSVWAVGRPNATDICLRCHFPQGWLEGRSDPTNASLMTGADYDGVQCDFCHKMYDPFFEDTHNGTREGSDWTGYWDEANGPLAEADTTYNADWAEAQTVKLFNGANGYGADRRPSQGGYTEATSGQYHIAGTNDKRASFVDAQARHGMLYSRFHKSKYFCATCHDVSNPVLANLNDDPSLPLTTEGNPAHSYFHVERTFSEFMLSAYGQQGGADGRGAYDPALYQTSQPGNKIAMCQDCHMQDVQAHGCNKQGAPLRETESAEHPSSGMPRHDLTGGNIWVPWVLASSVDGSSNFDATNRDLLWQGPAALTLNLTQGQGLDPVALLAGADRAKKQLLNAASITGLTYDSATGATTFSVENNSGHKLISGFPEGRRMFVNIKAYLGETLIYEVNPYDGDDPGEENGAHTLKGLPHPSSPSLGDNEVYVDELVYEAHPSSSLTGEDHTFHFALATGRYKDNRIPPVGFDIDSAAARMSTPVWHGVEDPGYFTADEYANGRDDVALTIATGADRVVVGLYYQTTSREYMEFLRDEIKGTADTLSSPTPSGEDQAYIVQTDPWFSQLAAWGDTIWGLWDHNKAQAGAHPFEMASAEIGEGPPPAADTPMHVNRIDTGRYNRGKWIATNTFAPGDEVVFRCFVVDDSDAPVTGAIVDMRVSQDANPGNFADIGPSAFTDSSGMTELRWKTAKGKGKDPGTPLGAYTGTVTGIQANNYSWPDPANPDVTAAITIQ